MARTRTPGTVYRRADGKWTAQSPEVYDSAQSKWRRLSLGSFAKRGEAEAALQRFHLEIVASTFTVTRHDLVSRRLGAYLDEWLLLVNEQVQAGQLARRTGEGYESSIRLYVKPGLGRVTIADLDPLVIHRWLTDLKKTRGLADRSVLRHYRTLHRACADLPLSENPARLPRVVWRSS